MHFLTLCGIVRDEGPFLREWVEFHRLVGFEHVFVYDNESETPAAEALAGPVAAGYATVVPVAGRGVQMAVYEQHARAHAAASEWTAFLDADEFLVPHREGDVRPLLDRLTRGHYGLAVNWQVFGTSGYLDTPTGPVTQSFTRKLPADAAVNRHVKSVVKTASVRHWPDPHRPVLLDGHHVCDEQGRGNAGPFQDVTVGTVQVSHYYTRSLLDWQRKVGRGRADAVAPPRGYGAVYDIDAQCVAVDESALRFGDRLRVRLAGG